MLLLGGGGWWVIACRTRCNWICTYISAAMIGWRAGWAFEPGSCMLPSVPVTISRRSESPDHRSSLDHPHVSIPVVVPSTSVHTQSSELQLSQPDHLHSIELLSLSYRFYSHFWSYRPAPAWHRRNFECHVDLRQSQPAKPCDMRSLPNRCHGLFIPGPSPGRRWSLRPRRKELCSWHTNDAAGGWVSIPQVVRIVMRSPVGIKL